MHASPEDALRGFLDIGARYMIPMHFGTFKLSQEPVDEPVKRLSPAPAALASPIACTCSKRVLRNSSNGFGYQPGGTRASRKWIDVYLLMKPPLLLSLRAPRGSLRCASPPGGR